MANQAPECPAPDVPIGLYRAAAEFTRNQANLHTRPKAPHDGRGLPGHNPWERYATVLPTKGPKSNAAQRAQSKSSEVKTAGQPADSSTMTEHGVTLVSQTDQRVTPHRSGVGDVHHVMLVLAADDQISVNRSGVDQAIFTVA
jgi:hypothetical protein